MSVAKETAKALLKAPIILYRYTLSAFAGRECRYLPTCSEYAQEAIDKNGPWASGWRSRVSGAVPPGGRAASIPCPIWEKSATPGGLLGALADGPARI